jgi:hypothetical protein|tara:strand:+ start:75 stop:326 length:252 start_codon:yes stop_codon:yes gene_type:complete
MSSLAAAPLAAQILNEIAIATMRAAFDLNLDLLKMRIDPGKGFTLDSYIKGQRIMNDRSDPSLKAIRIENLVSNGGEFRVFER